MKNFNYSSKLSNVFYEIKMNNGRTTETYHGATYRGKGITPEPVFDNDVVWGTIYTRKYRTLGRAITMLERTRLRMPRRSPYGKNTFYLVEVTYNNEGKPISEKALRF